ncbi:septal ring lytic transglycosylase RlpA family protein [Rhizobium sp. L1K21]|uniref:septal ring lytic transglycosylase RlpA family protein n=1 Tax=Rhizobium sp. L1K21 TaxID=2954933 RepID=UPI002093FA35|nr:septal ring lytic transglycosylase RlpA family protein [Rhizobium sp. L1K21]MCO6186073.1 septal ring lytic transglycosylase RlpA family protein [Rhizobium sp. L1K21]
MAKRHIKSVLRLSVLGVLLVSVAACTTTSKSSKSRSKEYFSESEYGVAASPRVAHGKIPKGGGRKMVGKPYKVKGNWFYPKEDEDYNKVGYASWYGSAFHGRLTANGEVYDKNSLSAAHPTLPLPSYVRVTNLKNGSSLIVRVNDRGPFERGRIIDLSKRAAEMLGSRDHGIAKVRVQYIGPARMDGHDQQYLMASYRSSGAPSDTGVSGVMLASASPVVPKSAPQPEQLPADNIYVTASALTAPQAEPAAFGVFGSFAALPDIGPVPIERPGVMRLASSAPSLVSGFVMERMKPVASARFETILVDTNGLTPESVKQAYLRRLDN